MKKKISIIGVGYVGLPLALSFSKYFTVCAFDIDANRISDLKKGIDVFKDQKFLPSKLKNLKFTNDINNLDNSDFFIVTVPTPVDNNNVPNLKPLTNATKIISKYIKNNTVIIYESTVYPGCTEEVCVPILEKISGLKANKNFYYAYSPERINVGDKKHNLENIKKIVSGSCTKALNKVYNLYKKIIKAGVYKAENIKVAEAAKVIENTQRDVNIALINELSIIFSKLQIDTNEVLNAASTKWNFVRYFPGLVGGHCVGVDPYYLTYKSKQIGYNPKVILSGRTTNDNMSKHIFNLIINNKKIKSIKKNQLKVLILGYSFKEDCSDIRNSKVKDLANLFINQKSKVRIFDPLIIKDHLIHKHKNILINSKNFNNLKFHVIILAVPHKYFLNKFSYFYKNFLEKNGIIFDVKSSLKKNKYSQITL